MASSPRVDPVRSRSDARAFVSLPYELYRGDPRWVAPLRRSERDRWRGSRNPSLQGRRVERFLARRSGRVVGRVAAVVDAAFSERWEPGAGFFGFLEFDGRAETARALLEATQERLSAWGCRTVLGPVALTTHDEVGLLVEGFDRRPSLLQPYNPPSYPRALADAGFKGFREYGAWEWTPRSRPSPAVLRLERMAARALGASADVRLRTMDDARFEEEIQLLHALYNRTFADTWGFVPMSRAEFRARGLEFRAFYRPELVLFAEAGGGPVAFALVLPDVNEALSGLDGRLFPLGWLRLVRRARRLSAGRFILMGVDHAYRGRGLAPLLALRMRESVLAAGLERLDVSLVQLDNARMVRVVEALGCRPTRRYRLYRKPV
jgi:GNAT superfamily N-acetyltransferase